MEVNNQPAADALENELMLELRANLEARARVLRSFVRRHQAGNKEYK